VFKKKVSRQAFDELEQKYWKLEGRFRSLCELFGVAFTLDPFDEGIAIFRKRDK
jgi:hypothetical protein